MPNDNVMLAQVLEATQKSAVQQEVILNKVTDLVARMDLQDTAIKDLRVAIQGNGDKTGLNTRLALIENHNERMDASIKELQNSDSTQRDDLKEIGTKFKVVTALLGLGGGGGGAAAVLIAQKLLGG